MDPTTITELHRTCTACPAQWEGKLASGESLYVRYRHGHLRAGAGASRDDAIWPEGPEASPGSRTLLDMEAGDDMDGFMTDHELRDHLTAAGVQLAAGVIADPCNQNHDELGMFGCDVCGQAPTPEALARAKERMERFFADIAAARQERANHSN